jgi:hypothetical protein
MRIEKLAATAPFEIRWRPFNLREILIEQNNIAFAKNQIRLNYNWRDIDAAQQNSTYHSPAGRLTPLTPSCWRYASGSSQRRKAGASSTPK